MSDKITIHLLGEREVFIREIDHFDPDEPQYRNLSDTEREVYHFSGKDQHGNRMYQLKGRESRHFPEVHGAS